MGIRFEIAPKLEVVEGIEACRQVIPISWFDEEKCTKGIRALCEYTKEFDERKGVYRNKPKHDWASHASDAFRTGSVAFRNRSLKPTESSRSTHAITDYDIFD